MKKPEQIGKIDPEPAVEAASIDSSVEESIVSLHHHKPFALEALHTFPALPVYRRRFIIKATHPASNPPPNSVVPK
jgi:hypothetical protein